MKAGDKMSDLIGMLLKDRPQRDVLGYLQTVMQDRVNSATKKAANYKITNDKPHPKIFCRPRGGFARSCLGNFASQDFVN